MITEDNFDEEEINRNHGSNSLKSENYEASRNIRQDNPHFYYSFFIRDLLECEKRYNGFIYKCRSFCSVTICGTVVSFFEKNSNFWIRVDDGSGSIHSLISKQQMEDLQKLKDDMLLIKHNLPHTVDNPVRSVGNDLRKIHDKEVFRIPSVKDLQVGIIVKVSGRLKEHNGFRNIFISSIEMVPEKSIYFQHLQNVIKVYKEYDVQ